MAEAIARYACLVLVTGLFIACSEDRPPASGPDPELASVTGAIFRIEDSVPVDGGVELYLETAVGDTAIAYLPSFFTPSPPPPEQWQIYQKILQLELGDRIRVEGEQTQRGIHIKRLAVLNG